MNQENKIFIAEIETKDKIFRALLEILSPPSETQLNLIRNSDSSLNKENLELLRLMPKDSEFNQIKVGFLSETLKESFGVELSQSEFDLALSELPDFKRDDQGTWTLGGLLGGFIAPAIENNLIIGLRRYRSLSDNEPFQFNGKRRGVNEPELPINFVLNESGVFYLDPTGERDKAFICSPLRVTSFTRDVENNSWGKLLEFSDPDGKEHSLVLPLAALSGDGAELRARLLDAGLFISPNKRNREKLNDYILSTKPPRRVLCVNQLGWHDGAFVLPDAVISEEPADIRLQNVDRASHKYKVSGTIEDWQKNIACYCVGNPRLMFAVSCAFAASLLPIAEEPSGGFHLRGLSSTGKTTALQVAGSVWGGDSRKGFLETWRATANGLEAVAELHNNALLCLDEISQINPHDVGETIYCLSNGFGKSRMTKDTKARRKTEWQLLFFSSGEKSLSEMMQGTGQRTLGGQEARFVDLEADAGKGFGLFETLHDFASASEFSKHLASASRKFYGAAIREFLPNVAGNVETIVKEIKDCRKFFIDSNANAAASGEVFRVASRFALVAVAGMLASKYGVTGWKQTEPYHSAEKLFQEWLETRGTSGSIDVARGVRQVLAFIEQHGASRFQPIESPKNIDGEPLDIRIQNRVGFWRKGNGGEREYLFLPEMFEREVCKGFTASTIAKELDKRGFLRRSEHDRFTIKVSLPELGRKPVYVIGYAERTDENQSETTSDI